MGDTSGRSTELAAVVQWFEASARDLPWRTKPEPWAVLVSEVMLQQTPVSRVLPVFDAWMHRWPSPHGLAQESPGEAVRMWGRLGYPRRALRLHAAATKCVESFNGRVPSSLADLRSLPGVGEYTAAAVAAFAFGQRHAVLDTNVRRVHARWLDGTEHPATHSVTAAERARALELLPAAPREAARSSVSVMELGALVCTAHAPRCTECPLNDTCTWQLNGRPAWEGPPRRGQAWAGTDRQCRGRLMAVMRSTHEDVASSSLVAAWDDDEQRERALAGLIDDGLIVNVDGRYRLP
ncbi:MAG TPA: A/G-specific adenine glycosylase [Actinomycetes bacterium]|nr:A/G-specific adenine glycosylase [Actinomycetes bacterium]